MLQICFCFTCKKKTALLRIMMMMDFPSCHHTLSHTGHSIHILETPVKVTYAFIPFWNKAKTACLSGPTRTWGRRVEPVVAPVDSVRVEALRCQTVIPMLGGASFRGRLWGVETVWEAFESGQALQPSAGLPIPKQVAARRASARVATWAVHAPVGTGHRHPLTLIYVCSRSKAQQRERDRQRGWKKGKGIKRKEIKHSAEVNGKQ